METLEAWDRAIVLAVNGWHQPWLDEVMWMISGKWTWLPIWLFFLLLAFQTLERKHFWIFLVCALVSIGIADFTASQFIKEGIQRYRPSHNLLLNDQLHFYQMSAKDKYLGGLYGFVSNHASNFFAITSWVVVLFWNTKRWFVYVMLGAAVLVSFSRLYLGVHYLSDLIGGALWGSLMCYLIYRFVYLKILNRVKS
jgi:undecaprenyl-diphosphatase